MLTLSCLPKSWASGTWAGRAAVSQSAGSSLAVEEREQHLFSYALLSSYTL